MNWKRFACCLASLASFFLLVVAARTAKAAAPNVIVVMTDDQGYGDLSFHGNPAVRTPRLDELARESIRLADFHVAPMCTPTRGQLLTGLDALRNRAMNVSSGRALLKRGLPTMASLFAERGYRTGMFGKWHLGDNYPYRPQDRGFLGTLWFPSSHIGSVPDYWENDYFDDVYWHNGKRERFNGYSTDVFFSKAMEWIDGSKESGKPFLVYLPLNAPHAPHFVPDKYRQMAQGWIEEAAEKLPRLSKGKRSELASYLGMIANIDENVGRLLKFLDDRKLANDTILVFLTDNGSTFGPDYFNAGMRGGKTSLFEGGHRVPCFIRWPGGLGKDRDVDELTEVQDLLPTLLDLCHLKPANDVRFDGASLAGLLRGEEERLPDRMLVVNYSRMPKADESPPGSIPRKEGAAVLWRKWRLLNARELYDLASDPGQDRDVSAAHPDVVAKMKEHLDRWWEGLGPDVAAFERVVIGNAKENPTTLSSCEWGDVFVDQQRQVRQGVRRNGVWHLEAEGVGRYEFSLFRWPPESELALTAAVPVTRVTDGEYPVGMSLPIRAARLQVAGTDVVNQAVADGHSIRFEVELSAGPQDLKATFLDGDHHEMCGAYYVVVRLR